jgi:hypothetical protein
VLAEEPQSYHPNILPLGTYPNSCCVPQNSEVKIYARVIDNYSKIQDATLSYISEYGHNDTINMKLINGTNFDGIYLGIIPASMELKDGTSVRYALTFKDDLNYSNVYNDKYQILNDTSGPNIKKMYGDEFVDIVPGFSTVFYSPLISDFGSGVKNVTLYYCTSLPSYDLRNCSFINMSLIEGDKWSGKYKGIIPPLNIRDGTELFFYIKSFDSKGLNSIMNFTKFASLPWWTNILNHIYVELILSDLDIKNYTVQTDIRIELPVINTSFAGPELSISNPYIRVSNIDKNDSNIYLNSFYFPSDFFDIPLFPMNFTTNQPDNSRNLKGFTAPSDLLSFGRSMNERELIIRYLTTPEMFEDNLYFSGRPFPFSGDPHVKSIPLKGDPLRYPFDSHYINLYFYLPIYDGVKLDQAKQLISTQNQINSNWVTRISNMNVVNDAYNQSHINTTIDFDRNYTIATLTIPLFAIFFLLGAIFIFQNSADNIGNRLALTLGIFALLFTLPDLIDINKPQTSAPTIADSMLSTIIIATIAFTISSIISSSSTIQKWFPKHHTWIDGIVFVIVSGFVIAYFNKYLLDSQLWWLVPIILFGLGYGLLLRALGIKINKPLIHFFKVPKKQNV